MKSSIRCPACGADIPVYKNPTPAVDIIIQCDAGDEKGIVLIERLNPPYGWALPGGFVEYGESAEAAAIREAREETSLQVELIRQLGAYSDPDRDPRFHTISIVFIGRARGAPRAADDAGSVRLVSKDTLPTTLAFDHAKILNDYFTSLNNSVDFHPTE
ncbi:MAG: NUDIX hydrolase [Deltaproteobacteria bacterium]|nr:NUDIX hydrolase [Deltaproteobacteria bacterium]MBW2306326.1 NUDIX hydrolase [Deltaproteobacteria bacterium]